MGPYELQDLFLYYNAALRYRPSKVAFLAWSASQSVGTWPQIPSAERHQYHIGEDEVPTVSSSAAASGNVV